ncbi:MAG: phytochelatin synthase family protein [Coleofasciculus sp. G1-WW12-02]|uniref:phytochelatin synthase family protein n=1 Tax=Coleofasciculus sp. G1-WW12-02 TaxID=3068483 RepID=UPI0032F85FF3
MHRLNFLKAFRIPLGAGIISFSFATGKLLPQTLPLSQDLINLNSQDGEVLLIESNARQDYFPLSIHFETQDNLAYCGVASMVMVLNALSIPAPPTANFGEHHIFTQKNVLNEQTEKILPAAVIARQGMTLDQLGQLLETYPLNAEVYHASEVTLAEFRQMVVENLQNPNNFVLVNYLRKTIGQERGGHISPIAAYNPQSDRFLILDVSRYKYPPIWVRAEEIWQAMGTMDSTSEKTRGFVVINRR